MDYHEIRLDLRASKINISDSQAKEIVKLINSSDMNYRVIKRLLLGLPEHLIDISLEEIKKIS